MVVEIIAKYLAANKRLIIPNLGTFIVKKPGEQILFSNLMKSDDGLLRSLLLAEGYSEMEAAAVVDRFVFEVNFRLQERGECRLKNFGYLRSTEKGAIIFEYSPQVDGELLDANVVTPQPVSEQAEPEQTYTEPQEEAEPREEEQIVVYDEEAEEWPNSEPIELGKSRYDDKEEVLKSTSIRRDKAVKGLKYKSSDKVSRGSAYKGKGSKGIGGWLLVLVVVAAFLAIGMLLWGEVFSSVSDSEEESIAMSRPEPSVPNPDDEYITPIN